jgi:hypothetical protein
VHPIGIDRFALPFSLFFCRVIEKKYLQSSKWGSIPRYLITQHDKGHDMLDSIRV